MGVTKEVKEALLDGEDPSEIRQEGYSDGTISKARSDLAEKGLVEPKKQMRHPPSAKIVEEIAMAIMGGITPEELKEAGYDTGSVDAVVSRMKKIGSIDKNGEPNEDKPPTKLRVFARGTPVEAIIDALEIPSDENVNGSFSHGMKFGMSLIVIGTRLAQELSAIGIAQARPLIGMSREMRSGEESAAKAAATDVLQKVGGGILGEVVPRLEELKARDTRDQSPTEGSDENPMRGMMMRLMEPLMQSAISKITPALGGGPQQPALPSGWTQTTEKSDESSE